MSDARKDALDALVLSPGWLLFKEHARQEWGPEGYGRKVANVIAANAGTVTLAPAVEKVHATTEEINALLRWPADELKKLQPQPAAELSLHRGGR